MDTPEIIHLLEEEKVYFVDTMHSQEIRITLKDGSKFVGTYVHAESGKYSEHEHFFDVYNLARHIRSNRPEKEQWGFSIE